MRAPTLLLTLLTATLLTVTSACGGGQGSSTTPDPVEIGAATEGGPAAPTRDVDPEAPSIEPPANATTLEDDIVMVQVAGGTERGGAAPSQRVHVRYRAWNAAGERTDTGAGEPAEANWLMMALPSGLREALARVAVGQTWRFWIPGTETYERSGDVRYEVELLEILERTLSDAPTDVAEAPSDATTTHSGLASRVLIAGTGTTHPRADQRVTVHYTGWTTDGEMFDSSVRRGREATFPLSGVIAGWTEGVQLMVVGEVRRFWIPTALAYGGRPGRPQGVLVFDIELMSMD